MKAEGIRRGAEHVRQVVDPRRRRRLDLEHRREAYPHATQIVDLYHAREHLHDLARLLEFMTPDPQAWLAARLSELDDGDIDAICDAARTYPLDGVKADDLDTTLGYFEHNVHRMRYGDFKYLGMFVGSGSSRQPASR